MRTTLSRRRCIAGLEAVALSACLQLSAASRAHAHPGPAEAPYFGMPECIQVADLRTTHELTFSYEVFFDDVEPESDHITLTDSKTHQFFAFRGTILPWLPDYELWPFRGGERLLLPLWIEADDVLRSAAANKPSIAPDFDAAKISDDVLRTRGDAAGQWLSVSSAPARVPITIEQSARGVRWDLQNVPAGVYQIAGYTFSPPYNAWEPRPGLIKLIDADNDPPAVTVDGIDGMLYAGQGRHITGCVDAPSGSTLSAWFSVEGESDRNWRSWLSRKRLDSGRFDLCFMPSEPLAGLVRVRVAVATPDGYEAYAVAPDTLVLVNTAAPCTPDQTHCCIPTPNSEVLPWGQAGAPAAPAATTSDHETKGGCNVIQARAGFEALQLFVIAVWFAVRRNRLRHRRP